MSYFILHPIVYIPFDTCIFFTIFPSKAQNLNIMSKITKHSSII